MTFPISEEDRNVLKALEEDLWRTETRFDVEYMERIFAPDFFEFGRSGRRHNREDCLALAKQEIDAVIPLPSFDVRLLSPDVAQVTCESRVRVGGEIYHANRSSIWSRAPAGWVLRFHQGTPVRDGAQQVAAADA